MFIAASNASHAPAKMTFSARVALVALILFLEKFALTFLVDYSPVTIPDTGVVELVSEVQHAAFRFAVAFAVSLAVFAYARSENRDWWAAVNAAASGTVVRIRWLAGHLVLVSLLAPLSFFRYRADAPLPFVWLVGLWLLLASAALVTLLVSLARWSTWHLAARRLGALWFYAAIAAAVATSAMQWSQSLWRPAARMTFDLVWHMLVPFIPSLNADSHTLVLSSSRFSVHIADYCSGLEGAGLLLTFCSAWLLCFRKEYVFPRALFLLPACLVLSFAFNAVRIAALMLIGYAGFPDVAIYGFHSQAGWIAFSCAAGLIAIASYRMRWLRRHGDTANIAQGQRSARQSPVTEDRLENPTAAYLLPFLAILGASMLDKAVSSGFETLYVLRPAAAALALAWSWPRLRAMNWHCSWRGLFAGVLVFALWAGIAHLTTGRQAMPMILAAMSAPARILWLIARVGAAVIVVPLAEELAFRGYLMRRVTARDFDSVRFHRVGAAGLIVSALVYGLEYGDQWLPATVAGLVFGILLLRTERMGEAVAAHATTNALLALYVLCWGQWQLW